MSYKQLYLVQNTPYCAHSWQQAMEPELSVHALDLSAFLLAVQHKGNNAQSHLRKYVFIFSCLSLLAELFFDYYLHLNE